MKLTKKLTNKLIDRFIITANELPHEIKYSHKEDGWHIFKLSSFNFTHEIGYKNILGGEVALFS